MHDRVSVSHIEHGGSVHIRKELLPVYQAFLNHTDGPLHRIVYLSPQLDISPSKVFLGTVEYAPDECDTAERYAAAKLQLYNDQDTRPVDLVILRNPYNSLEQMHALFRKLRIGGWVLSNDMLGTAEYIHTLHEMQHVAVIAREQKNGDTSVTWNTAVSRWWEPEHPHKVLRIVNEILFPYHAPTYPEWEEEPKKMPPKSSRGNLSDTHVFRKISEMPHQSLADIVAS